MLKIGCHLSCDKGYAHMAKTAESINADTFQFFSRNPRGSRKKKTDEKDAEKFNLMAREKNMLPVVAHAPYILNSAALDDGLRHLARRVISEDLANLEYVPGNLYTFHPGNHMGQGMEKGIELIAETLNPAMPEARSTYVLLETMSGKGTEVGSRFEEIRAVIDRVEENNGRLGVCLDTCHVYSAGYDIVGDLEGVVAEFDRVIGLERLKAIHLNDSLTPFASKKDRHAPIGKGSIGFDALKGVINHPALRHLPFILETPNELDGYAREIAELRESYSG